MMTTALTMAFAVLTLAISCGLLRLARGPTVIDRIMAFDLITTSAVGMIVLLAVQWKSTMYLELILIYSLLGFFSTVSFVYYLSRTRDLEDQVRSQSPVEPKPHPADQRD